MRIMVSQTLAIVAVSISLAVGCSSGSDTTNAPTGAEKEAIAERFAQAVVNRRDVAQATGLSDGSFGLGLFAATVRRDRLALTSAGAFDCGDVDQVRVDETGSCFLFRVDGDSLRGPGEMRNIRGRLYVWVGDSGEVTGFQYRAAIVTLG